MKAQKNIGNKLTKNMKVKKQKFFKKEKKKKIKQVTKLMLRIKRKKINYALYFEQ